MLGESENKISDRRLCLFAIDRFGQRFFFVEEKIEEQTDGHLKIFPSLGNIEDKAHSFPTTKIAAAYKLALEDFYNTQFYFCILPEHDQLNNSTTELEAEPEAQIPEVETKKKKKKKKKERT